MVLELSQFWGSLEEVLTLDFVAFDAAFCGMLRVKSKELEIWSHANIRASQGSFEGLQKFLEAVKPSELNHAKPVQEDSFLARFGKGI